MTAVGALKPGPRTRRLAAVLCSRWGFAAASLLFFCFYAANMEWRQVDWASLFASSPNGDALAEAKRLGLSYEAALADPSAAIGKPVVWCVDHPARGYAYAGGKPSQPLILQDPSAFPTNSPTTGGRCDRVLAVVTAVEKGGVSIRFLERR